jgi:hypothetical protein
MSSPLTENDGDKHLRENPEFPHGTVSLDDVLLDFLASIIEAKYPVITGFLSQSVGIMQK